MVKQKKFSVEKKNFLILTVFFALIFSLNVFAQGSSGGSVSGPFPITNPNQLPENQPVLNCVKVDLNKVVCYDESGIIVSEYEGELSESAPASSAVAAIPQPIEEPKIVQPVQNAIDSNSNNLITEPKPGNYNKTDSVKTDQNSIQKPLDKANSTKEEQSIKPETILPNISTIAVQKIISTQLSHVETKKIELTVSNQKLVYKIEAVQETKFLWIIPIQLQLTAEVNAQTGEIEKIEKPWWSFLVG